MFTYNCKILRVIDGDTVDIQIDLGFDISIKERVRLLGVNTPEVFGAKANEQGESASEFTKQWFASRTDGTYTYASKKYNARDKYGRSLGVIMFKPTNSQLNESLNDILINQGWKN